MSLRHHFWFAVLSLGTALLAVSNRHLPPAPGSEAYDREHQVDWAIRLEADRQMLYGLRAIAERRRLQGQDVHRNGDWGAP